MQIFSDPRLRSELLFYLVTGLFAERFGMAVCQADAIQSLKKERRAKALADTYFRFSGGMENVPYNLELSKRKPLSRY